MMQSKNLEKSHGESSKKFPFFLNGFDNEKDDSKH